MPRRLPHLRDTEPGSLKRHPVPNLVQRQIENLAEFMGPGREIDTSRFYAIAVDALGNGVSCSPSNSQGKFPEITIRDMVNSQYRLLTETLGIRKLHAVVGVSMGGMQTFEWMVAYPEFMERAAPIVGSPKLTTADLLLWRAEHDAIEAVQKAGADPRTAMPAVLGMHEFALYTPQYRAENNPTSELPAIRAKIDEDAAKGMDPRDWAAQLRAMMAHDISKKFDGSMEKAGAAVHSRVLVVVAPQDHMVNPTPALLLSRKAGFGVLKLNGNCGHMAPSCEGGVLKSALTAFLAK